MKTVAHLKTITGSLLSMLALVCFGVLPKLQAVVPAPDGGYPGANTAEGQAALLGLTTGGYNTSVGYFSLRSDTTGSFNTGIGAGTLFANTADENTAIGVAALFSNTTGGFNTADGAFALISNTEGGGNTAIGERTLQSNTIGNNNTAIGILALFKNTEGGANTAVGFNTLFDNTTGGLNAAIGPNALSSNTTGNNNIAIGFDALDNNTTGSNNIVLGDTAGVNITTANNVICIGSAGADVSNGCYIGQIFGATSSSGTAVLINSNGKLGTMTSSRRFKQEIKPMDRTSELVYALKPVSFHYKKEIDPAGKSQFGLVAEDVEKVNPDLVVRDIEGKPYSVRYDQVNAMLLNEFLKEHRAFVEEQHKVEQQQKEIGALKAELKEQRALIQKVSARVETSRSAPQMALTD